MKKKALYRRAASLLLAVVLLASLLPAALAADTCPQGGSHNVTSWEVIKAANCHEMGVRRGVCSKCSQAVFEDIPIDPYNHDAYCTDNGDGETHTATCPYHDFYKNVKERHTFVDGRCSKCLAVDYSSVALSIPHAQEIYVNLNDAAAAIALGDVALTIGSADITGEYNLTYSWYYNGSLVYSGKTYAVPASITAREGDYNYVCFVMAVPKSSGGKPVSGSCTVTVRVRDLVEARATISTGEPYFDLDNTNSRTPASVWGQIYDGVRQRAAYEPAYVVFESAASSKVGRLTAVAGMPYYFYPSGSQAALANVRFEPDGKNTGSCTVNFTAYDARGNAYPGTLTFAVEQSLEEAGVLYATAKGIPVGLRAEDFERFWEGTYPQGALTLIRFTELPDSSQGVLYDGYTSAARPGSRVRTGDGYYCAVSGQSIGQLTFAPASGFTGCAALSFEACGQNNRGVQTYLSGTLFIVVSDGAVRDVQYTVSAGGSVKLSAADFLSVYQTAAGGVSGNFYIQLLEVPASGALYLNYTGSARDTRITAANASLHPLYYSSSQADEIGDVTYLPGTASSDTVRYAAYSARGELLYVGSVTFTRKAQTTYTKSFLDVKRTDWFYTYVMDLAEAGVINGMTTTTYEPKTEVTYGMALKLIMKATGYADQTPTGKHWASGYLTAAQRDGLIGANITESYLDRKISRYAIAEIAAKAMKLPGSTMTSSPFTDMAMTNSSAPYVLSLYEAGILEGNPQSDGTYKYYGVNSIIRSEMAAIVWRINNYKG